MISLLKTPNNRRRLLVFIGDLAIMVAVIMFLVSVHRLLIELRIIENLIRPLKLYALCTAIPVFILISYIFEIYDIKRQEKLRTFTTLATVTALSFGAMFALAKVLRINRTTIIYVLVFFVISLCLLYAWRSICRRVLLATRHLIKQKILFIGIGRTTVDIIAKMKYRDYNLVGCLVENGIDRQDKIKGPRIIGSFDDLKDVFEAKPVDVIVTASDIDLPLTVVKSLYKYKLEGTNVYDSSYFYELLTGKVAITRYMENDRIPYFNVDAFSKPVLLRAKRLIDFWGALSALIILSPLFLLIMAMIKLTSKGPVFFVQQRVGFQEKLFGAKKFRTMIPNAEQESGPTWARKNDARVTKIGAFLRKTRLDELPQLINIIRADMSFVGPRPFRKHFVDMFEQHVPFYSLKFSIKPGLTGWAQVNHHYSANEQTLEDNIERLQYDLYYIKHASIFLDIHIILKTLQTIICRPAY